MKIFVSAGYIFCSNDFSFVPFFDWFILTLICLQSNKEKHRIMCTRKKYKMKFHSNAVFTNISGLYMFFLLGVCVKIEK